MKLGPSEAIVCVSFRPRSRCASSDTNRGGPAEIIRSALHGILVPPRDPAALANAIQSLADDDERRQLISRTAREFVESNFDIRVVVPRIEDFYRRVVMRS